MLILELSTDEMVGLVERARGSCPLILNYPHHNRVDTDKNPWVLDALKQMRDEASGQISLDV